MIPTLSALFQLSRPLNCLITALSVYVGAFTAGLHDLTAPTFWAALAAAFITAAGNAFNDIIDLEIDRINRPDRPLPAGHISKHAAQITAFILALSGLLIAAWIGQTTGLIALVVVAGLIVYSTHLKHTVFWGNLTVSLLAAAAFPYGALVSGTLGNAWIPAGFACLYHLGREIIKDMEDVGGDRLQGKRTLPLRHGLGAAAWTVTVIYLTLALFVLFPWGIDLYGLPYLLTVGLLDLLLLYALIVLYRHWTNMAAIRLSRVLIAGMFIGLLAIVLGEL